MEIREVTTYNKNAPFTGYGIWLVFELKYRKVQLIHPIHLTELVLTEYEYVQSSGNCLWPFNNSKSSFNFERWKRNFKERIAFLVHNKTSFSVPLVAKIIAELDNSSIEEATRYIGSLSGEEDTDTVSSLYDKASREYRLRDDVDLTNFRGRQLAIVNAFKETKSASIYQITHLVEGKLKTKSKLSRVVTYYVHRMASQGVLEIVC